MNLTGSYLDYFIVFWAGVLVSFTPCVYPVIPLTAGYIAGVNIKGSRLGGFFISLVYVFGIALTYCGLAAFAALTGKLFGQFQNHPGVFLFVAVILTIFGLSMMDILNLPSFGVRLQGKAGRKNVFSILVFGMAAGLVIGPCTAPILGTLLLYIASKQNIIHGISLMFVFSYGIGTSLILVGTFSGLLSNLPKSGAWLARVKQFCGIFLLILSVYFYFKFGKSVL